MTQNVQQVIANMANLNASVQMTQVPVLIKAAFNDTFKYLESQSREVKTSVYNIQNQLNLMERDMSGALKVLQKSSTDVTTRVDNLTHQVTTSQVKQANSNSAKGKIGESTLYDLLSEKLTSREHYRIDVTAGIPHSCDLNIRRTGFPDVRVEVKAHGQQTLAKVGSSETAKFRLDLGVTKCHGIFVPALRYCGHEGQN